MINYISTVIYLAIVAVLLSSYRSINDAASNAPQTKKISTPRIFKPIFHYLSASFVFLMILLLNYSSPSLLQLWKPQTYSILVGTNISVLGLALFIWSIRHINTQYSPCYDAKMPSTIIKTGPYRLIRHPIYSANVLLLSGGFVALGSLWRLLNLAILLAFYFICINIEEDALSQEFSDYIAHKLRTGKLFPKLLTRTISD